MRTSQPIEGSYFQGNQSKTAIYSRNLIGQSLGLIRVFHGITDHIFELSSFFQFSPFISKQGLSFSCWFGRLSLSTRCQYLFKKDSWSVVVVCALQFHVGEEAPSARMTFGFDLLVHKAAWGSVNLPGEID